MNNRSYLPSILAAALGSCALLLFSGCDNDRADTGERPVNSGSQYSARPAFAPGAGGDAAPQTPDPLLSGSNALGGGADPLLRNDPLIGSDPLKGRAMPTDHSHWLRGRIQEAHLTVLLNGIRQGAYTGVVDQDITMRLRSGINTVTFLYVPQQADSSAQMDLVESEHDPPIPPLATFQSTPPPDGAVAFPPTTQSFTFFAK